MNFACSINAVRAFTSLESGLVGDPEEDVYPLSNFFLFS